MNNRYVIIPKKNWKYSICDTKKKKLISYGNKNVPAEFAEKCLEGYEGSDPVWEIQKIYNQSDKGSNLDTFFYKDDLFEDKTLNLNLNVFEIYKDSYEKFDWIHNILLKEGLNIFYKKIQEEKYKNIRETTCFTGGTSLMFKYSKEFYRFSVDLDFTVPYRTKEIDEIVAEVIKKLLEYCMVNGIKLIPSKIWWRFFSFEWDNKEERQIKIDYMGFPNIDSEKINFENNEITKSSDLDILCNKLFRIKGRDILDITFLIQKHNYKLHDIISFLSKKESLLQKNVFSEKMYQALWREHIPDLPFLKDLLNYAISL